MTSEYYKENVCMADTQEGIVQIEPGVQLSEQKVRTGSTLWHRLALIGIMLISILRKTNPSIMKLHLEHMKVPIDVTLKG